MIYQKVVYRDASRCFVKVITLLNKISHKIIKWPSVTLRNQLKEDFSKSAGLMGVVGAIDGTFVVIKAPKAHPHVYSCRKCYYAMQLQVIAITSLKFTDVFTGYPGSVGDRRVFQNSDIYRNVTSSTMEYFGNDEYIMPIKPILYCPGVYHHL